MASHLRSCLLDLEEQRFALHFWSKRLSAFDSTMVVVARHIAVYPGFGYRRAIAPTQLG